MRANVFWMKRDQNAFYNRCTSIEMKVQLPHISRNGLNAWADTHLSSKTRLDAVNRTCIRLHSKMNHYYGNWFFFYVDDGRPPKLLCWIYRIFGGECWCFGLLVWSYLIGSVTKLWINYGATFLRVNTLRHTSVRSSRYQK